MRIGSPTGLDEARAAEAVLGRLLPPPIRRFFDATFVRSYRLYDEFIYRLVLGVVRETDLPGMMSEPVSAEDLAARAGFEPLRAVVPLRWMLRFLSARGAVEELAGVGEARYRAPTPLPDLDPGSVREAQLALAPSWAPSYTLAETAARDYPAFLRGETAGEDVLFSPRRLRMWIDYFSNDNGLYAVNNRVGAVAATEWLPRPGAVVLELGGGLGSGALALLDRLSETGRLDTIAEYRFTEFVPAFLRRGEQALRARQPGLPGLACAILDMNEPFASQGVALGTASIVFAVNTLHVARDMDFTLGEVRAALEPGGRLVISECVRPRAGEAVATEFVFNLTETFRSPRLHPPHRPTGGFLTAGQWRAAMEVAGFADARVLPDLDRILDAVPEFGVAAIGATRPP